MLSFVVMLSASSDAEAFGVDAFIARFATPAVSDAKQNWSTAEPEGCDFLYRYKRCVTVAEALNNLDAYDSVKESEVREMTKAQRNLDLVSRSLERDELRILRQLTEAKKVYWEMQAQVSENKKAEKLLKEQERELKKWEDKLIDLEVDNEPLSRALDCAERAEKDATEEFAAARKAKESAIDLSRRGRNVDSKAEKARDALEVFNKNVADMRKAKAQKLKLSVSVKGLTAKVKAMRESDAVRTRQESLAAFSQKIDKLYSDLQRAQTAVLQAKVSVALGYSAKEYIESFTTKGEGEVERPLTNSDGSSVVDRNILIALEAQIEELRRQNEAERESKEQAERRIETERELREQAERKVILLTQEKEGLIQRADGLQRDVLAAVIAEKIHGEEDQIWAVKVQNLKRRIEEEQARREANEQRILEMRSEIERLRGIESEIGRLRGLESEIELLRGLAEDQQERAELRQYFVDPVFTLVDFTPDIQGAITSLAPNGFIAGVDPKRISFDFTDQEYGVAVAIAQMCLVSSRDGYLTALTMVFSPKRANALLEKMTR